MEMSWEEDIVVSEEGEEGDFKIRGWLGEY
jgi:hypothetical protein